MTAAAGPAALVPAILAAAGLLAVGVFLRTRLGWLRRLYVPAAAVAGVVGLVLLQAAQHAPDWPAASMASVAAQRLSAAWSTWPGTLIAVVFAGLLLERPREGGFAAALHRGARSAALAWVIILGQIAIGLVVYVVAVRPVHPGVPATFAQLLEVSWAGGPGSAAGMGALYAREGFAEGRDLGFFLATVGLVYGVVSGLAFVNLAIRRGWVAGNRAGGAAGRLDAEAAGASSFDGVRAEVIEPLALQVLVLAAAYAVGLALQGLFLWAMTRGLGGGHAATVDAAGNVPLFLFTLLGGWVVRRSAQALGDGRLIDVPAVQRLVGVAMEFLIVAGIASVRIDTLGAFVVPVVLLLLGAAAWSAFCLLVLSKLLLPRTYWFELGLLNYGFSTANTPQGMMLLRIVDPQLTSGAAEDYAVAAPLSAPFVGGGVATFVVLPQLLTHVAAGWVLAMLLAGIGVCVTLGLWLARRPD